MRKVLKKVLNTFLHPVGLNIERHFGSELALKKLVKEANDNNIDLLIDVGANIGQYATKIIDAGFTKQIISFEPLSSEHPSLMKISSKYPNWRVYEKCAIGDFDGEIDINISQNKQSNSILQVSDEHLSAAPGAAFTGKEKITIKTLDSIMPELEHYKSIMLKIDTQGYEKKVLDGAVNLINEKVKIIQLEMSLLPLYEGILPFEEMVKYLVQINFRPLFYSVGYIDRYTDQIQQLEGYFIKSSQ